MGSPAVHAIVARRPIWLWPNLLSLDAPCVAVAWYVLLARNLRVPLDVPAMAVLAVCVWAIYVADRLLDIRADATYDPASCHHFAREHSPVFAVALLIALSLASLSSVSELSARAVHLGAVLTAAVGTYFICVHRTVASRSARPELKRAAVALLFGAGVVLPVISDSAVSRPEFLVAWLAVSALVWTNTTAIQHWEVDAVNSNLVRLTSVLTGAMLSILSVRFRFCIPLAISALLVFELDWFSDSISRPALRVCVDAALFLPALISSLL